MKTIYLEIIPKSTIDIVLFSEEGLEVNQNDYRPTWNLPTSDADGQTFRTSKFPPIGPQGTILYKKRVLLLQPKIGTYEDETIGHRILERLRTR